MTRIVTYRPTRRPKAPRKPLPAKITGAAIVSARKPGKGRKAPVEQANDPEADARVAAFFARNIKPYEPGNR